MHTHMRGFNFWKSFPGREAIGAGSTTSFFFALSLPHAGVALETTFAVLDGDVSCLSAATNPGVVTKEKKGSKEPSPNGT